MKLLSRKNKITINGVSYEGHNISIDSGVLRIDNKIIDTGENNSKQVIIHGNINNLKISGSGTIYGSVKSVSCKGDNHIVNKFIKKSSTDVESK